MPGDWELDDWEEDAFDDDVWDAHQDDCGELEQDEGATLDDASALREAASSGHEPEGGRAVSLSAWDVGTIFALGGWLADRHAEQTARQAAAALAERGPTLPAPEQPRGAAHPPPASGYSYGAVPGMLTVGAACDPEVLFAELQAALSGGHDLMISLQGRGSSEVQLTLVISVVPSPGGPQLWVVAEGIGSMSRVVPVFDPEPHGRFALFATDFPQEAVDAAVWACQRMGIAINALTVTERRPDPPARPASSAPEPRLLRSADDARAAACDWLRWWGFDDAMVVDTPDGAGVSVASSAVIAQVDVGLTLVDDGVVRGVARLARIVDKRAAVFSLAGLTEKALLQATSDHVACFRFDLQGEPKPLNQPGATLVAGADVDAGSTRLLRAGERVDPARLASTLLDALVDRELLWVEGHLAATWTEEPVVWRVELEDGGAYLSFYPLTLGRRWVRAPHPALTPPWKSFNVIEDIQREYGTRFPIERIWETVESGRDHERISYLLFMKAGDIDTTLHRIVDELEAVMRAFGTPLDATELQLGQTRIEMMRSTLEIMRTARRHTDDPHLPHRRYSNPPR